MRRRGASGGGTSNVQTEDPCPLEQLQALRAADRLEPPGHRELPVDVLQVGLDGIHREIQLLGNFFARHHQGNPIEDIKLAGRQRFHRVSILDYPVSAIRCPVTEVERLEQAQVYL